MIYGHRTFTKNFSKKEVVAVKATTKILFVIFFCFFSFLFFARPVAADVSEEDVRAVSRQLGIEGKGYYVSVVDYPGANAHFDSRGNQILITRPMLTVLENREQLAFVLAHEVSHSWLGHVEERIQRDLGLAVGFGLALRYGVKDPDWRAYLAAAVAQPSISRYYDRRQELAADEMAVEWMAERGFDPHSGVAALERMGKFTREKKDILSRWFATHPLFSGRIDRVREKAEKISPRAATKMPATETEPASPVPPIPSGAGRVVLKNTRPQAREISLYWHDSKERPREWSIYRVPANGERAIEFTPDTKVCVWLSAAKGGKGDWSSFQEVKEGETIIFEVP